MAVKERDVVLTSKDSAGNPTIDLPITRLGNIEAGSEEKTALADADAMPVLDSADSMEMKKISWANVITTIKKKLEAVFAAASHKHSATEITSDTLGVPRGGTGKSDFTTGNYLLGNGGDAVEEKTPSQVLADIGAVPTSRTVNGKALSGDISLTAADIAAVPTSRTVNGKALSGDISLVAADIGAATNEEVTAAQTAAAAAQTAAAAAQTAAAAAQTTANGMISEVRVNGASVATSGIADIPAASTSAYGATKLSSTLSTSQTLAATQYLVRYAINRTTLMGSASDTNYTTYMARGEALNTTNTTPTYNGQISWTCG